MREARAVVIALVIDEDLRLVLEAAERNRVNDPIAIALERRSGRAFRFRVKTTACMLSFGGVGRERRRESERLHRCPSSIAPAAIPEGALFSDWLFAPRPGLKSVLSAAAVGRASWDSDGILRKAPSDIGRPLQI
jgi:hypothetical protein